MKNMEVILKFDRLLKESKTVQKSERPDREKADELLYDYAGGLRSLDPDLSVEKAYAQAMTDCPVLAGLAAGHTFNQAVGHY
jgi:hypothetical protein